MSGRVRKPSSKAIEASSSKGLSAKSKGKKKVTNEEQVPQPEIGEEEAEKWLDEMRGKKFVIEKTIHPTIDVLYGITNLFRNLGWERCLELSGEYYPELVLEFYSEINLRQSSAAGIHSEVQGKSINVTPSVLLRCLGLPNKGLEPSFATVHEEQVNENDRGWSKVHALANFDVPEDKTPRH